MTPENETNGAYNSYMEQKGRLDFVKEESEKALGRKTLIIASGAFLISVALLRDLFPNPLHWSRWMLVLSWMVFGFTIFLELLCSHESCMAVDEDLQKLRAYYIEKDKYARNWPNRHEETIHRIHAVTPWIMLFGFFCMVLFAGANFVRKEIPMPLVTHLPIQTPKAPAPAPPVVQVRPVVQVHPVVQVQQAAPVKPVAQAKPAATKPAAKTKTAAQAKAATAVKPAAKPAAKAKPATQAKPAATAKAKQPEKAKETVKKEAPKQDQKKAPATSKSTAKDKKPAAKEDVKKR